MFAAWLGINSVFFLLFFSGKDVAEQNDDSDSEKEEAPKKTAKNLTLGNRVAKKTKKRKKKLERALEAVKKHNKNKKQAEAFNFSALHLIHDPQDFAEKLFKQLEKTTERFEVKLMMIDLISRLVGIHKLILLNFYPFMKRFVQPHQHEVCSVNKSMSFLIGKTDTYVDQN